MGLPTLSNDFPCLKCPQVPTDNQYPVLDFMRFACKNMTARFVEMPEWLKDIVNYARYSGVPVGNMDKNDAHSFMIDTQFARSLIGNKHLLWYSESGKPDLGGHEDRDFRIYY